MTINCEQFWRPDNWRSKKRTAEEFLKWQETHGRTPHGPVPIKYDTPERKFDRANPVWYSIRDFVNYARQIPGWAVFDDKDDTASQGTDWDWGYKLEDCLKLYDTGWDKGFSAVKHGMDQAATAAMTAAMKEIVPMREMHGGFIDIDAFIKGEPDCMFEFNEEVRPVLHLEVEIDSFVVCSTEADEVMYRGVAIMAGIMALRRLGIFVTAYQREVATTSFEGKGQASVTATVHMMNQDLTENLSEVLIALCHPGFHRKVYFQAVAAAWGCTSRGLSYNRRNSGDFYPKPGSGKIVIPGHFRYKDDTGVDWGNSWASPKAAEGLVHMMLKAAAP